MLQLLASLHLMFRVVFFLILLPLVLFQCKRKKTHFEKNSVRMDCTTSTTNTQRNSNSQKSQRSARAREQEKKQITPTVTKSNRESKLLPTQMTRKESLASKAAATVPVESQCVPVVAKEGPVPAVLRTKPTQTTNYDNHPALNRTMIKKDEVKIVEEKMETKKTTVNEKSIVNNRTNLIAPLEHACFDTMPDTRDGRSEPSIDNYLNNLVKTKTKTLLASEMTAKTQMEVDGSNMNKTLLKRQSCETQQSRV